MSRPQPARAARSGCAKGFSAIELLAAAAVLAVLTALAVPGFTLLLERWRVRQAAAEMQATLYYARSEAIRRGGNIVVRKNVQNTDGCQEADTTQAWGCGWFVFVDTNGNGTRQANETLLQTSPPPRQLNIMRNPSGAMLRFDRYGMANGANILSFTISPTGPGVSSPATQTLCMASGGRVRVLEGEATCQ